MGGSVRRLVGGLRLRRAGAFTAGLGGGLVHRRQGAHRGAAQVIACRLGVGLVGGGVRRLVGGLRLRRAGAFTAGLSGGLVHRRQGAHRGAAQIVACRLGVGLVGGGVRRVVGGLRLRRAGAFTAGLSVVLVPRR